MKRKLFLLLALMLGFVSSIQARTDVTSSYLTDAELSNETANWALTSSGGNHNWNGDYKYHESWHNTFTITQTTTALPAGYYQLSIQAAVEGGNSTTISLQATSGSNTSVAVYPKYSTFGSYADMAAWWAADATHTGNRDLNRIFTTVYVEEGQTLTATFKQTANNQWFVYGQMQLFQLTDDEGRRAQIFEAAYNSMTNLDMASGRFKQRFEDYTNGTVTGKKLVKTISGLPNGYYNVTLNGGASYTSGRGFDGNTGDNLTVFYANNASTNVTVVDRLNIGNEEFTDYTANNATVNDGSLEVGYNNIEIGANWFVGSVKYIEYLGGIVASEALPLPANGVMAGEQWYYFDITVAGDNYNATADDLDDIICTADGSQFITSVDAEITLTATGNTFVAGRYYVKSSSDNNLVVEPASYNYNVSEATADKEYIQPSQTVTVSFTASTNDPDATLTQNYSGVTFDGAEINVVPGASGFTFTVPANVAAGCAHTLAIPAGAIGYAAGGTYNVAQNITLTTPAIFDGVYYMYNTGTETYISRAGNYNTQAILDNWGLAFNISTDANNETKLQYFDSQLWLGDDGSCYGDCTEGRVRTFNVTAVSGGYKFLNTNNDKYLAANNGATVADAEDNGTTNIWALESTTAHVANYTANADVQAAAAASGAGIAGITTKAALETELAENYGETPITITGSKAEKYQVYPGDGKESGPVTYYSETVNDLKPGLYKLSVNAFQRAAGYDRVSDADGARGIIYLYAGSVQTQIKSVMEYGANDAYDEGWNPDYEYDNKHYPNSEASGYVALATGNYTNDVYVYVADGGSGTGSLEIGIKNPSRPGNNCGTWAVYDTWTLTYYQEKVPANLKVADGKLGTFIAPFDITLPDNVKAYSATSSETTVTLTKIAEGGETLDAGTPVIVYGDGVSVDETFYGVPTVTGNQTVGALTGILDDSNLTITSGNYVLQTQGDEQAFYILDSDAIGKLNRCYVSAGVAQARLVISIDEEDPTAINAIEAANAKAEGLKDGKYLIGNKIVLVKNGVKYGANGQKLN